jgi:diguanylate cyclase (GGDEF)-like protein
VTDRSASAVLPVVLLVTLALIPAGVMAGGALSWTAPAATLFLLSLPTAWAALRSTRGVATAVGLVSVAGCVAEALWAWHGQRTHDFGLTILAGGVVLALSGLLQGLHDDIDEHKTGERENSDDTAKTEPVSSRAPVLRSRLLESSTTLPALGRHDIDPAEFSALLLALQEVARRIAGDLDLETLPETIVSTGANLLDARDCRLLWWHQASRALVPRAASHPEGATTGEADDRGVTRWVVANRKIAVRGEAGQDETLQRLFNAHPTGADAVVPLIVGGELLGLLTFHELQCDAPVRFGSALATSDAERGVADGGAGGQGTPSGDSGSFRAIRRGAAVAVNRHARIMHLLSIVGHLSSLALKNALLYRRIEEMATRDGLTGLRTHANFHEELEARIEAARTARAPLSVVISDIDSFKRFNDDHGHQAGDEVLRETARIWTKLLPAEAVVGRYGGEEFVCVLPGYDLRRGAEVAEALRAQIELHPFCHEGRDLRATASFGVAELSGSETTGAQLIALADKALYEAKRAGRNVVREAPSAAKS